eukprot:750771-Hanusia_phi.AAC.2
MVDLLLLDPQAAGDELPRPSEHAHIDLRLQPSHPPPPLPPSASSCLQLGSVQQRHALQGSL